MLSEPHTILMNTTDCKYFCVTVRWSDGGSELGSDLKEKLLASSPSCSQGTVDVSGRITSVFL